MNLGGFYLVTARRPPRGSLGTTDLGSWDTRIGIFGLVRRCEDPLGGRFRLMRLVGSLSAYQASLTGEEQSEAPGRKLHDQIQLRAARRTP